MPDSAPLVRSIETTVPALGAGVAGDQTVGEAPFAGTLTAASFTPEANITGDATNKRTLTIVNKGADGNGATVMATLDFVAGVNATDFNEQAFTLSAVPGATTVAAGDILAVAEAVAGAGLANPGGLVTLELTRA